MASSPRAPPSRMKSCACSTTRLHSADTRRIEPAGRLHRCIGDFRSTKPGTAPNRRARMAEIRHLNPHDPTPEGGHAVVVLRRFDEDDPHKIVVELTLDPPPRLARAHASPPRRRHADDPRGSRQRRQRGRRRGPASPPFRSSTAPPARASATSSSMAATTVCTWNAWTMTTSRRASLARICAGPDRPSRSAHPCRPDRGGRAVPRRRDPMVPASVGIWSPGPAALRLRQPLRCWGKRGRGPATIRRGPMSPALCSACTPTRPVAPSRQGAACFSPPQPRQ